jgi:hypothetical protein
METVLYRNFLFGVLYEITAWAFSLQQPTSWRLTFSWLGLVRQAGEHLSISIVIVDQPCNRSTLDYIIFNISLNRLGKRYRLIQIIENGVEMAQEQVG